MIFLPVFANELPRVEPTPSNISCITEEQAKKIHRCHRNSGHFSTMAPVDPAADNRPTTCVFLRNGKDSNLWKKWIPLGCGFNFGKVLTFRCFSSAAKLPVLLTYGKDSLGSSHLCGRWIAWPVSTWVSTNVLC